jgi:hypothetical protein
VKGTFAVAAREIGDKRLVLLGAFLVGILPLAMPLLPGLGGAQARDARFVTALFLSLTIAVAFPVVFGATVLVSDITQKRFAFYFSRPLPAASIWAGKLLAVLVVSVSGACLAAIPTVLFDGKRVFAAFETSGRATAYFLLTTLLLLVGAHTVSSIVRLRSAWIVLDFFLTALFAMATFVSLRRLVTDGFWNIAEMNFPPDWFAWWAVPLIATLLVASYVQVADGRTDVRRSHGALSATLWGLMTLIALPLVGLAWWVNAATPKDLDTIDDIQPAPHGAWVSVSGGVRARGSAHASFLSDTESGRFVKRAPWFAFSANGTRAAWWQARTIRIIALDTSEPTAIDSNLGGTPGAQLALSPSGRRLAVSDGKTLAAYDLSDPSNPKQLLALRADASLRTVLFLDEDRIRLSPFDLRGANQVIAATAFEIEEISLLSKKSLVTGRLEPGSFKYVRVSADGRYLAASNNEKRLTLHDGRTGALLATLSEDLESPKMRFLSGDRMAVAGVANGKAVLKIFLEREKSWSAPAKIVDLGPAAGLLLGGEIAPGRVAVALNPFRGNDDRSRRAWKIAFVYVATGAVSAGPDGLVPADRFASWFSPVLPPAEADAPSSRLFLDADSRLVRLDPATSAQTVLLGRSK